MNSDSYDQGYFQNVRSEMLAFLPQSVTRLLDIGCGEGVFGAICKQQLKCETWGLESNSRAAETAIKRLDRVLVGDAVALACELPEAYFDVIVCNDVLEHFAEPDQLLVSLRRRLSVNGVIVSSIPNIRHHGALWKILVERDFPREDYGIFDRSHLRFFTRKSIVRMFTDSGYVIERLEGINPSRSSAFRILNLLLFGALSDCRYLQFACIARPLAVTQIKPYLPMDPESGR